MTRVQNTALSALDYVCVGILLLFAGGASALSRSVQSVENPLAMALVGLLVGSLCVKYRVRLTRRIVFLLAGFLLYYLLLTIKVQTFHYKFLVAYPFAFLASFGVIAALGLRFFQIYERILVFLSVIGLLCWSLLVVNQAGATTVFERLTFLTPYNELIRAHVIVFTVVGEQVESFLPRNAGFAWEPGAFSVFICLAIFINLAWNGFKLKGNWSLLFLVAALASTQSTTGYSILLLLGIFWLVNQRSGLTLAVAAPAAVLVAAYIASLPFMYEKVQSLLSEDVSNLTYTAQQEWNRDRVIYAQRIASFEIDYQDFLNNPVLGYGGHDEDMWTRKEGLNVISISGIGKVLAKFGLVGLIFFLWCLVSSSRLLARDLRFRGWIFPALMVIQVAVSYSLVENPVLMCFWMFALFAPKRSSSKPAHKQKSNVSTVSPALRSAG